MDVHTKRQIRSAAGLLILSAALAACGGAAATPAATGPGQSSAPAGSSAPSSASSSVSESPSPAASADLSQAGTAIAGLNSYQAHITMATGSADLIVIHTPSPAESFTATEAGRKIRLVVIGPAIWVDEGTGTFKKNALPASAVSEMTGIFDPARMFAGLSKTKLLQYLTVVGTEQKNSVATVHFHGDSTTVGPNGATIPPGGTIDLWVAADGGYLVAFEGHALAGKGATAGDISIEITNINDPANAVNPPA